ncbi:MAG: peptide deformylase [SAR324 cluster bacterium]|uniref:Peptide deformylase n=1 Tax=SAR324 cluster bacterium TaxID=2024889 RepID=A0A2A4T985_9DELT|nr:MAG: peptide deformylase [SAR324 cluster bacterium]
MTVLNVLTYPHPILKIVAKPVTVFGDSLRQLTEDMIESMYDEKGLGLAATQVGEDKQLFVMDVFYNEETPLEERNPLVIINPKFTLQEGEQSIEEGCLSVPEFRAEVKRFSKVSLEYLDIHQETQTLIATDLMAICVQHEFDHLQGKLFIDRLPRLKRNMIQTRLKKLAAKMA